MVLSKQSSYNRGFVENTLSRKNWIFMNLLLIFAHFWDRFFMKNHVFLTSIFASILIDFLMENCPKMAPKNSGWYPPLLAPKIDPGAQADFWMPFGPPLVPFWRPLAPFWLPLAPLGSFLIPFWLFLALLGSVLAPFGRPLVPFRRPLAPFCSLFIPFYNIFATMALVGATFAPICAFPTFRMSNFFNNLVFWAPEAATHPLSIRFRFLLIPNTIFA